MQTAARLGLYGGALALVFTSAVAAGGAFVPDRTVTAWTQAAQGADTNHPEKPSEQTPQAPAAATRGVSIEQDGYLLSPVAAPLVLVQKCMDRLW